MQKNKTSEDLSNLNLVVLSAIHYIHILSWLVFNNKKNDILPDFSKKILVDSSVQPDKSLLSILDNPHCGKETE